MNRLSTSNGIKGWIRSLGWGAISALLAGACFAVFLLEGGRTWNGVLLFIFLGFGFPALLNPTLNSNIFYILEVTVFWFLIGAAIATFIKNSRIAVGIWLLLHVVLSAIAVALFVEIMN